MLCDDIELCGGGIRCFIMLKYDLKLCLVCILSFFCTNGDYDWLCNLARFVWGIDRILTCVFSS